MQEEIESEIKEFMAFTNTESRLSAFTRRFNTCERLIMINNFHDFTIEMSRKVEFTIAKYIRGALRGRHQEEIHLILLLERLHSLALLGAKIQTQEVRELIESLDGKGEIIVAFLYDTLERREYVRFIEPKKRRDTGFIEMNGEIKKLLARKSHLFYLIFEDDSFLAKLSKDTLERIIRDEITAFTRKRLKHAIRTLAVINEKSAFIDPVTPRAPSEQEALEKLEEALKKTRYADYILSITRIDVSRITEPPDDDEILQLFSKAEKWVVSAVVYDTRDNEVETAFYLTGNGKIIDRTGLKDLRHLMREKWEFVESLSWQEPLVAFLKRKRVLRRW